MPQVKLTGLAQALDAFSRESEFDAPIYGELLRSLGCATVIELGAGAGRLVGAWLALGLRVVAVEREAELRSFLGERFSDFVRKGSLVIKQSVGAIQEPVARAVLIAPYNVVFHFAELSDFCEALVCASALGVETALMDMDDISDAERLRACSSVRRRRRVGRFVEEASALDARRLSVRWKRRRDSSVVSTFSISLHTVSEIASAVKLRLPGSRVTEVARAREPRRADVTFLMIKLNTPRLHF